MIRLITFEKNNELHTEEFEGIGEFRTKYPNERLVKIKYKYAFDFDDSRYHELPNVDGYFINLVTMEVMSKHSGEKCKVTLRKDGWTSFTTKTMTPGKHKVIYITHDIEEINESIADLPKKEVRTIDIMNL